MALAVGVTVVSLVPSGKVCPEPEPSPLDNSTPSGAFSTVQLSFTCVPSATCSDWGCWPLASPVPSPLATSPVNDTTRGAPCVVVAAGCAAVVVSAGAAVVVGAGAAVVVRAGAAMVVGAGAAVVVGAGAAVVVGAGAAVVVGAGAAVVVSAGAAVVVGAGAAVVVGGGAAVVVGGGAAVVVGGGAAVVVGGTVVEGAARSGLGRSTVPRVATRGSRSGLVVSHRD